ncbi:diphthine--ammonia ligase [Candidatus Bathyarchaeota archaeon]|nr:diphthine--ammonia ligase [Candidatus Bathyarchaeota archaeon]
MPRVAVSWSGGKDSCLACYKAILKGFKISYLLNIVSKENRVMSHGLNPKLMVAQSEVIGIPIIQREATWETYEEVFKETLMELKREDIKGAVFGDIDVQEHKDWVDRICSSVGIIPIEPLWGIDPEQVITDFINAGFKAIVVNVKADLFGEEWLRRRVDKCFLEDLRKLQSKRNIHICGELGEYHTFVVDGPIFKGHIKILGSRKVLREGYWKYRLLDVFEYEIEWKRPTIVR